MVEVRPLARTAAIALGVLLGINLPECGRDNSPDANGAYHVRVTITQHNSPDAHGILYFDFGLPDGRAVVSVDGDMPLAKALQQHAGKHTLLTLEPVRLER